MKAKEKGAQRSNEEDIEEIRRQVSLPSIESFHPREVCLSVVTDICSMKKIVMVIAFACLPSYLYLLCFRLPV